jgi:transcriptional regulator with XRE-family HTH domain
VYTKSSLAGQLSDKSYRDAFVGAQVRVALPMQCRALRESRGWTQPQLAEAAGMSQPRISEIERPGERKLNLDTLLRLASAFDVALQVRFVPFSELIDDDDSLDAEDFYVASFDEDIEILEKREEAMKLVTVLKPKGRNSPLAEAERGSAASSGGMVRPVQDAISVLPKGGNNEDFSSIACESFGILLHG